MSRNATPAGAPPLRAGHHDLQRDEVLALRLVQLGVHRGDEEVARHHLLPFTSTRREVEQPELADRPHDGDVARVAERLVLHDVDLALVGERHRADAAAGVERLERAHRLGELHRLELAQRVHLRPACRRASTQDGVV